MLYTIGEHMSEILAIITAVASVFAIGSPRIKSRIDSRKRGKFEFYQKQLSEVFEPLEILFEKHENAATDELMGKIDRIIFENYPLLPLVLLQEYNRMKSNKDTSTAELRGIVSAYYNFNRHMLLYPYDHGAIKLKYLDKSEQHVVKTKKEVAAAILSMIVFVWVVFSVWMGTIHSFPVFVFYIFIATTTFLLIYGVIYGLVSLIEKIPKGKVL